MTGNPAPRAFCCSFCGRSQHEVAVLIAASLVSICNLCVEDCQKIVDVWRDKQAQPLGAGDAPLRRLQ